MDSKDLKSVLLNYCENDCRYAVMLNGDWGAGKTAFIQDLMFNKKNKHKNPDAVYISLFGVKKPEDIKDAIISELTSIQDIDNEAVTKSGKFLGSLIDLFSDVENPSTIGSVAGVASGVLKNRILKHLNESKVLIFDDFERCEMEPATTLSCINQYVEQQKLKAIILCNELNVGKTPEEKDQYASYKEKVVLYTYELNYSASEKANIALENIALLNPVIHKASLEELTQLIDLLHCTNLRTINLAISCFDKIITIAVDKNKELENNTGLTELMFACLVFAIGFRERKIEIKKLKELSEGNNDCIVNAHLGTSENKAKASESPLFSFHKEIVEKISNRHINFESCFNAVCLGVIDEQMIARNTEFLDLKNINHKEIILRGNLESLPPKVFSETLSNVLLELKNKTLSVFSGDELISLLGNLQHLVILGGAQITTKEFETIANDFVDHVIHPTSSYKFHYSRWDTNKDKFIVSLSEKLDEGMNKKLNERSVAKTQGILMSICSTKNNEAIKLQELKAKLEHAPRDLVVFTHQFTKKLGVALENAESSAINDISYFLKSRFGVSNTSAEVKEEVKSLVILKSSLKHAIKSMAPSQQRYFLSFLVDRIEYLTKKK